MSSVIERFYGEELQAAREESRREGKVEGKVEGKNDLSSFPMGCLSASPGGMFLGLPPMLLLVQLRRKQLSPLWKEQVTKNVSDSQTWQHVKIT